MQLKGKNVLITGGSRGIGKATAIAFAEKGAQVCINFVNDKNAAIKTVESLPGSGHFAARADIANPESVQQLFETISDEFGFIDVVVNNAGVFIRHPLTETSYEDWQKIWNKTIGINLTGVANVCYFAARQMIEQGRGGHIINVSSRGAFRGEPEHTAYGASKAGLNALSQSLALELGKHEIYVSAVAPGFVETDMTKEILDGPMGKAIKAQSPLKRVATPDEIAQTILFLASEKACFLTGSIVDINGASYLRS